MMDECDEDYSSSDDSDYVPAGASDSDSGGNQEENGTVEGKVKKVKKDHRKRKGGIKLDGDEEPADEEDEEHNELEADRIALEEERLKAKEEEKEQKEKEKSDDLWASLLSDVGQRPRATTSKTTTPQSKKDDPVAKETNVNTEDKPLGGKDDAATTKQKTVTVTKLFDFAGEEVKVVEEVKVDVEETKKNSQKPVQPSLKPGVAQLSMGIKRKPGGLSSVLGKMNKKTKISVLDKSKMDWNSFKRKEGIDEDLRIHNKGKDGFLQKQDFLQETDLRQYEVQLKMRMGQSGK